MSRFTATGFVTLAGLAGLAGLAACSTTGAPPTAPASAAAPAPAPASTAGELSAALAPLAWWLGDWAAADGSTEHWIAVSGAVYGVGLHRGGFEVLVVDDGAAPGRPDGVLRLYAMPDGRRAVEFQLRALGATAATFANEAHDFPKTITYQVAGDGLAAVLGGGERQTFAFRRASRTPAPELEAADLAFAADTAKRGIDGWLATFDAEGGMVQRGQRIDLAGVRSAMAPLLAAGRLDWAPTASGKAGDLGFTVGKATYTGAKPEDGWRSSYVTIWRRQPAGGWKVLFDTGRPVHDD